VSAGRIARVTLWLGASAGVLALAALLALQSSPARRYLLRQLLPAEGVRVAELDYNLFSGTAVLTGLELGSAERPFLRVPSMEINVAMRALLGGRLVIESVAADGINLEVAVDAEGRTNLPELGPRDGPPLTQLPDVVIERLRVSGSFTYSDPSSQIALPRWTLTATGSPGPVHRVHLAAETGQMRRNGWSTELAETVADARVTRRDVTVEDFQTGIRGASLSAKGRLDGFVDPRLHLLLTAGADLSAFPEARGASGRLTAEATVTGPASEVTVQANLAGRDLATPWVRGVTFEALANWTATDGVLRVENARLASREGAVSWSAVLAGDNREVNARLERLDVARISRLLELPVTLASHAQGAVRARWQGINLEAGELAATIRLTAADVRATREMIPMGGTIEARLRDREAALTAEQLTALDMIVEAAVRTHLDRKDLSGALHLRVPDIAPVLALAGVGTDAGGRAEAEIVLGGRWNHPAAAIMLLGEELRSGPVRGASLTARAHYDPARFDVEEARIRWQGAEIAAEGSVAVDDPAHPLRFTAQSTEFTLPQVLGTFGYDYPIAGSVTFEARGEGPLTAPRIEAAVTGRDLAAYGEPVGALAAELRYTHPRLEVSALRILRPEGLGEVSGSAAYDLDSRDYSVNLRGAAIVVQRPEASAAVDLRFEGAGRIEDPTAEFTIAARNVVAQERSVGELAVRGTLANRHMAMRIEAPQFRTTAAARLAIDAPHAASLEADVENFELPQDFPVRGSITAHFEAAGELERWQEGTAAVTVSAVRLDTPAGAVRNVEPIRLSYRNHLAEIASLELASAGARASLRGTLPGALSMEGEADLAALAIQGLEAAGHLHWTAALTGDFERMTPAAQITLREGRLAAPGLPQPLERVALEARLNGGLLQVERISAALGTGLIDGEGAIPLRLFPLPERLEIPEMSGPARFRFGLTGLTLASVAELPKGVNGALSLTLEARAERPELDAVTATVTIPQLIVAASGVRLQTTATPPVIRFRDRAWTIERFPLTGPGTELEIHGRLELPEHALRDAQLTGRVNVGLLAAFVEDMNAAGEIHLRIAAEGSVTAPRLSGVLTLVDGRLALRDPRVDAANVEMRVTLDGRRARLETLAGEVNGGSLAARGEVELADPLSADLMLALRDVFLEAPAGLQTRSSADLRLRPRDGALVLSGEVTIHEGGYSEPLDLQRALQLYLEPAGGVTLTAARDPLLERLQFDVAVRSADPVVLDNNLGRLSFTSNLRLTGDYYRPGLTGRVEIGEEGRLRLQERDYVIERGVINFTNETRIEPLLDIVANTQVRDRRISVRIGSDAQGGVTTELTSDNPEDTRADILALLLTGKTAADLEGGQMQQASERAALSLVAGSVSGRLSQQVRSGLGATAVRLEPNLISQESDPTARLTLGQDLTRFLQLIYSMNLRNSSDQIWSVNYNIRPRINTRATKQDDNSYRFDFQHDVNFGLGRVGEAPPAGPPMRVAAVVFTGELGFPEEEIRKAFGVRAGDPYRFFAARDGLTRLERFYQQRGHLEARLRMRREQQGREVSLRVEAYAGPKIEFRFEGWRPPGKVRKLIQEDWQRGVFDSQRSDVGLARIASRLAGDGYLRPELSAEVRMPEPGHKIVLFTIDRGQRYREDPMAFEGAREIPAEVLRQQLLRARLLDQPKRAADFLRRYYQQEGFLDVSVEEPEYVFDDAAGRAQLIARIVEGPRYRWGTFTVEGARALTAAEIEAIARIPAGAPYTPLEAQASRDRVEEEYWRRGYRDVRIAYTLARDPQRGLVNLAATIEEGPQSIVQEIAVEGTRVTSEKFVKDQIVLRPGDPFDFTKTNISRRHLYDTGAFSAVDLRSEELPQQTPGAYKNVRLLATVQEPSPYRLRYGAFFDTERGPGAIVDLRNRNTLGGGRIVGFRGRFDSDVREARGFFSQPLIRSLPLRTDATTFFRREFQRTPLGDGTQDVFITDRVSASVQEGWQLRNRFFLTFGYRFERAHTYEQVPNEFLPFDETVRIAPLTASLTRDTRDEILDATRGSFASVAGELAAARLGSTLTFARVFGQYFHYFPLTSPAPVPFSGGLERSRLVFATGVRVGIARGLGGQTIARSQRFFTGGGTTLRGFAQDSVGPVDILGRARGGEALLLLNNELRFPIRGLLDGVAFLDVGNIYSTVEQMRLNDLRKSAGPGLRIRTPYFLLRLDYGVKLDRRVGESRGAFFFSIGQAF
jgi:outer membrane protein assembly complex protein YaeT